MSPAMLLVSASAFLVALVSLHGAARGQGAPTPPTADEPRRVGLPEYAGPDAVTVWVESNKPTQTYLYQAAAGGPSVGWLRLCLAPCNRAVDPKGLYRVGGAQIVDSKPFRLERPGKHTLFVDAASTASPILGWTGLGLGLGLGVPGVFFVSRPSESRHSSGPDGNKIVGGVLLANAIPWLIVGTIFVINSTTSVKNDSGELVARVPRPGVALFGPLRLQASGITF